MKNKLIFVKIGLVCGAGVVSILATAGRLQAQNNLQAVKEVSLNKIPLTSQHLSQTDVSPGMLKASQITARNNISAITRAQCVYFLEKQLFTSNLDDLGIKKMYSGSKYYSYRIEIINPTLVQNVGTPTIDNLKSYVGFAYATKDEFGAFIINTMVCESRQPSKTPPPPPQMKGNEPECPAGFDKI